MKIIHTDNFNGDYPDEKFVIGLPLFVKQDLQQVCDLVNKLVGPNYPRFYTVVPDDYELKPGFEP